MNVFLSCQLLPLHKLSTSSDFHFGNCHLWSRAPEQKSHAATVSRCSPTTSKSSLQSLFFFLRDRFFSFLQSLFRTKPSNTPPPSLVSPARIARPSQSKPKHALKTAKQPPSTSQRAQSCNNPLQNASLHTPRSPGPHGTHLDHKRKRPIAHNTS